MSGNLARVLDTSTSPDGSPIEVYLALPSEPDLGRVCSLIPPRGSVLDLGAGVGRLANPLAAMGYGVVAVDDSPEMLAHVVGAEAVLADIWTLDLDRRFTVVLALSHLVNDAVRERRSNLLTVCREHLSDDGIVLLQRYAPSWIPTEGEGVLGEVGIRLHTIVDHRNGAFSAVAKYTVRGQSWEQSFTSARVGDDELRSLAAENGLRVRDVVEDDPSWVVLSNLDSGL